MAEITQVLGFEATAAIATLNSLNGAIKRVNTSIRAMNKATASATGLSAMSTNLNKVNNSAKAAGTSMTAMGTKAKAAAVKGNAAANSMTVSWSTLARVVGTQVVVRGIAALQQQLGEAANRTKEFETASLRAAIVSEEGAAGVDTLRDSMRDLTIATGRTQEEINEATTEALQKDLGSTKDTMNLLEGAADDLARVTGTDLVSSVNSISSVMKAFGLPLSEADNIADTFFTTIDKGDIKMNEIESRLGTVNPLVAALGGNFEDAAGAAAALTLSGLNTQTAMTQLRNVTNKLIRPTDAMKEVFEDLGVASGNELIDKFGGLEGALTALRNEVGPNNEEFGELFNSIRGLLGALTLTSDKGKILAGVMVAMKDNTGDAKAGADELKKTLSFLNDTNLQTLLREIDTLGPALNETRLGATILATGFIKVMKDMADATVAFKDAAIANFNDVVQAIDNFSRSGTAKINDNRIQQLKAQAAEAKAVLSEAQADISRAGTQERFDSGLVGEQKKQFDELSKAKQRSALEEAKITEQAKFVEEQIRINTEAQKGFAEQARNSSNVGLFGDPATQKAAQAEAIATSQKLAELSERAKTATGTQLGQIKQELDLERRKTEAKAADGQLEGKVLDAQRGQLEMVKQNVLAREKLTELGEQGAAQVQLQEELKREQFKLTADALGIELPEAAGKGQAAIEAIPDPQVDASAAIAQMNALRDAAIAAKNAVASTGSSQGGDNLYHGGRPIYRAAGGPARGQDTQATMLSKGEFVTNARSAAKFFPQLSAMNAGQRPAYRDQGGSVTNVGDVNVNVTGGSGSESPDVVGRQIANSLRRELRRKTSAL